VAQGRAARAVGDVAELKEDQVQARTRPTPAPKEKGKPNRMGLVLSDLTAEQRKEADVASGVLVEDCRVGRARQRPARRRDPRDRQQGR
jgi:serine protease Do